MTIFDISWPISPSMTGYKDRTAVSFQATKNFEADGVRSSVITIDAHAGTHVDAPAHFLFEGATIDQVDRGIVMGACVVLDVAHVEGAIGEKDLHAHAEKINAGDIVLLRTKNSALDPCAPFDKHFMYLDASGAAYLIEKKIKSVGIDYLGIERSQPDHATHRLLFQAGVGVVEGLRLAHVTSGRYFFICLSLFVIGLEAAPARAILMSE